MKRRIFTIIAVIIMLAGIGIMLYPIISNLLYERQQNELVEFYGQTAEEMPQEEKDKQWEECSTYNKNLLSGGVLLTDPFEEAQLDPASHPYVDQIKVVLPDETEDLQINAQEDYVTLVTCTPYGINTHRLLVRGVRVPYVEQTRENEAEKLISEQKNTTLISRFAETDKENYTELLRQMEKYNTGIYENGQSGLKDAWSYAQNPFDFDTAGLPDDMIGYITIEAMNEKLPLYIGANEENMGKGAVVMGQTSMPIGGENTNCVIAAHRGYRWIPMFQYIEVLQPGDKVEITNLWETLEYEVVKSIVIYPDNIDAVKIIPGEDMLTLITCHPYTQNYQRYVVYCRRAGNGDEYAQEAEDRNPIMNIEGADYESSEKDIEREQLINRAGMIAFLAVSVVFISVFLIGCRKKRRKKKK